MSLFLTLILSVSISSSIPELIAHRGESHDAPENTLAAFRLAWERKVPTIELDVRLSKDGQAVVIHDADTERVAGTKLVIEESTLDQLRQLDVGAWKGEKWKGERIPTLEESLATIPEGCRCFIEIKVGPEAVPATIDAIKKSGKQPEQLVIISFKAPTVAECKRRMPHIEAYYLSSFKKDKKTGVVTPSIDALIKEAKSLRADGLNLSHEGPHSEESINKIKAAGLKFLVWTVDDPKIAKRFAAWKVDGITTNRGEWMRKQLTSTE